MSVSNVFINIFNSNKWTSKESISGTGSEIKTTSLIRESLPNILDKYDIKSILDIPCGDFNWMKEVSLDGIKYIGADIVPKLIEDNKIKYPKYDFKVMDVITSQIPKVDLIIVRDCLVHLSNDNVKKAINNIKNSGSKYLLTTSFVDKNNTKDIIDGEWRSINVNKEPFSLPKPVEILPDGGIEFYGDKYKNKSMVLINIGDIEYYENIYNT